MESPSTTEVMPVRLMQDRDDGWTFSVTFRPTMTWKCCVKRWLP